MRVDKLHLHDFGQFHEKDITLAPGINVLYGANEAGKSTIKDFIVDMMYGIEKSSDTIFDHYEQKRPINGLGYSGSMEVSVNGTDYLIERNFDQQSKYTGVRDLDNGTDVALAEPNNLVGTLIQTDKSTYMNTLCLDQMSASTDKEIADKLNNYIVNMASTKTGDIDAVNAIMELKKIKEKYSNRELEEKENELSQKLSLDRDFDAEIAAVREEYTALEKRKAEGRIEEKLEFTPIKKKDVEEEPSKEEVEEEPLTKREKDIRMLRNMGKKSALDNVMVIIFLSLVFVALFVVVAAVIPVNIPEIKMGIMIFGIALVALTMIQVLWRRAHLYKLLEELEIEQGFEEAKADSVGVEALRELTNRIADLKVKEQNIVKEREEQEQVLIELNSIKEQMRVNQVELTALDLAMKTIQDLSEEIYDSFGNILNGQVSKIISKITNGKYSEVRIDDQLRVMVKNGDSFISMEYLSTGTMEQIYLALRLTIADVLIAEDMPIIMDDSFVTYDYARLKETLSCLGEYLNRQIIIFSMNPGIQDMFTNLGITSNYIVI